MPCHGLKGELDCRAAFEDLVAARPKVQGAVSVSEELHGLVEHAEGCDPTKLAPAAVEARSREQLAVRDAEREPLEQGVERLHLGDQLLVMSSVDDGEVLAASVNSSLVASRVVFGGREQFAERIASLQCPRETAVGDALPADFPDRGRSLRIARDEPLGTGDEQGQFARSDRRRSEGQQAARRVELRSRAERVERRGHARSIIGAFALTTLLFACGGQGPVEAASTETTTGAETSTSAGEATSTASTWPQRASFGRDPIVLPEGKGSISRAAWRGWLCRRFAKSWLEMLAMDRAVAAELGYEPGRDLVGHCRRLVRDKELLVEVQPARNGAWRSAKVQHDLAWCLARLWLLRRGPTPERLPNATELVELFEAERRARNVTFDRSGATCEGCVAEYEEVYPDVLALRSADERDSLLRAAIREATSD